MREKELLIYIYIAIMSLEQMPERFHLYDREPWKNRGLHLVPVDNYCVLYIVDNGDMVVSIMRVMYGGRVLESRKLCELPRL